MENLKTWTHIEVFAGAQGFLVSTQKSLVLGVGSKWNESPWVVSEPLWGNRPARRGFCRRAEVFALRGEVLCFWGLEYLMNGMVFVWILEKVDLKWSHVVASEPLWGKRTARRGFRRRAEVFALRGEVLGGGGLKYLCCSQSADLYPKDSMRQVKTRKREEDCEQKRFSPRSSFLTFEKVLV